MYENLINNFKTGQNMSWHQIYIQTDLKLKYNLKLTWHQRLLQCWLKMTD